MAHGAALGGIPHELVQPQDSPHACVMDNIEAYEPPTVVTAGSLRDLTLATGKSGMPDANFVGPHDNGSQTIQHGGSSGM